jgi:hypothetical protein
MKKRPLLLALVAVLLLGGVAFWLVYREPGPAAPADAGTPPTPAPPVEVAQERPSPVVSQSDLDQAARAEEARAQYYALKSAFDGGRANDRSRERMEVALKRLWPSPPPSWRATCLNRVCQVVAEEHPGDWRAALRLDPGVGAIADRIGWDPDGGDPAAYVLLSAEDAQPGAPALERVEKELRESPAVRACLARASGPGTVELELIIDSTGITYLRGGTADPGARSCVEDQLAEIITRARLPAKVKSGNRKITLQTSP